MFAELVFGELMFAELMFTKNKKNKSSIKTKRTNVW